MAHYIMYNGESSLSHNVYVSGDQTFNAAEKDYDKVSIPGRSGDLMIFKGRYKNVDLNYKAIILPGKNWPDTVASVREWLLKNDGYVRLEDTYNPNEYRVACFTGPVDFTTYLLTAGETTLTFNCKPQRYLKSGDEEHKTVINAMASSDFKIDNPTSFTAKPRIRVLLKGGVEANKKGTITFTYKGFGDTAIKTNTINIDLSDRSAMDVTIDSDILQCMNDNLENLNNRCAIGDFPEFPAGSTTISWSSSVLEIQIIPRWWRI